MRIIATILLIVFFSAGCGKPAEKAVAYKASDKILATVNGEPIYNKDIKLALALRIKENPNLKITPNTLDEQLQLVIDERLALQHKQRSNSRIEINLNGLPLPRE